VNHRSDSIAIAAVAAQPHCEEVIGIRRGIAKDGGALSDAADDCIDPAIAIEISKCRAAMQCRPLEVATRPLAYVGEAAAAGICQQQIRLL